MSELETVAAEAWAAMVVPEDVFTRAGLKPGPMDVGIALDMVQNVTGEREEAAAALLKAAADWLTILRAGAALRGISSDGTMVHTGNSQDAETVAGYLRTPKLMGDMILNVELAQFHLGAVHQRSRPTQFDSSAEARACVWWERWAAKADLALKLCRQVIEAAYPVT